MGNLEITELILIIGSLAFWGCGLVAVFLGVLAFFRGERLARRVRELEARLASLAASAPTGQGS
ncbi:MAG: hypothetical protein U0P81_01625 [Holophagaceae bacterium]